MATDSTEWAAFDPGFDHGTVEVRKANIDGVFSASKLDGQGADVRTANCDGRIGDEAFDWSTVKGLGDADVRAANCKGQLGGENFDWGSVDPTGETVRKANLDSLSADAFDSLGVGAAVRKPNCEGQIGDAAFNRFVVSQQTALTPLQKAWRLLVVPLTLAVPAALAKPAMAIAPGTFGPAIAAAALSLLSVVGLRTLARRLLMVKQGQLALVQYFEDGTTHLLQAGVHLVGSFGATSRIFDLKQDHMSFGTITFVRVRPGFVGKATDNGLPMLLLPGQHLYNAANFDFLGVEPITSKYISNGPLHLIRVPPSYLGMATINKKPLLLDAGLHFLHAAGFEWSSPAAVSVNEPVIRNGPVSLIRVPPGSLGLGTRAKQPVVLGAGLHFIHDAAFEWSEAKDVTESEHIRNGPISFVRVRPGHLGLALVNKRPAILDAGVHFVLESTFEYLGARSVNDDLIQLGPVTIVRVGPGLVGLATLNGRPLLLEEGVHFVDEPSFQVQQQKSGGPFRRVDEVRISHGTVNVLTVPRGSVWPVLVNGEGHFLLEGRHFINQPRLTLKAPQSLTEEWVCAGTRHRIVVPRGKLGLALEQGEPVIYEPGSVHLVHSSLFEYRGSVDVTQQLVSHGSLQIVTVKDGQVGITYDDGVLSLLPTGRHFLTNATHTLAGFVSTGQQTLRIAEVTGMSLDNVELTFDAAICIRVVDAQKAVVMLTSGKRDADVVDELHANVQERAKLDLCTIIGKSRFNKKHEATSTATPTPAEARDELPTGSAAAAAAEGFEDVGLPAAAAAESDSGFRSAIHDDFMVLFRQEMLEECGVEVINMAVEDVRIVDHELAKALASAAVANSALERQHIDAEIVQVRAAADAKVASLDAEGKAAAMKILARAEADRIATVSNALEKACPAAAQQETIRATGGALSTNSTVLLAQDMGALGGLLGGAQGSTLAPPLKR